MTKIIKNFKIFFLILAFIEGGAVMCVELCSAKILSPFFGTSIYVWASVLGITLTALMSGYYLGGYISSKNKKVAIIFWLMLIAGCFVSTTPIISDIVLPITINLNLLLGTIISLMCFLFVPLMLFGAVSPLIINLLTDQAKESGKSSGTVYAVSTLGGIITTFTVGFYTLPQFGITYTLYGYGILVMVFSSYLFIKTKTFNAKAGILLLVAVLSFNFQNRFNSSEVIYQSEGILGEIKVVDRNLFNYKENKYIPYRELMVNNISQTIMDKNNPDKSYWDYVNVLTYNINSYSSGDKTLLLGLGGGTLYKQLENNNLKIDVVEIDKRIEQIAKKYFQINSNVNVVVDDARHYLNISKKKYDIIIYDLYNSETPPIHLMTKEAFGEIKTKLNKNGILVVNFYGFIDGSKGKAARSIYKTLLNEKYQVRLMATPGVEKSRNLLFICSKEELKPKNEIVNTILYEMDINFDDALILTDDKPILEHIYLEAALAWRNDYNEVNAKYFLKTVK
jgi:predicted membrane-bound spermidine synthase